MEDNKMKILNIGEECTTYAATYGANVNVARATPDERDGHKPVHRRILYALFNDLNALPSGKHLKVMAIVGAVAAKYHPHGEATVALVAMAQPWVYNYPLIDGDGNFGNEFGHDNGQTRYIKAKLSRFAYDCYFAEYDKSILDMVDCADGVSVMPEYLPSKYPMLLVNGSYGIGWAKMTSIPPHNLKEVFAATMKLMLEPDTDIVLYPDSPTGCDIVGLEKFEDISMNGTGSFKFRANIEIEEKKIRDRTEQVICVKTMPYGITGDKIEDKIKELAKDNKLPFVKDVLKATIKNKKDNTVTINLDIVLRRGYNPHKCLEKLLTCTPLENSYVVQMNTIRGVTTENLHSYKSLLTSWIKHRRDIKSRIINHKITEIKTRLMVLDGLIAMLSNPKYGKLMEEMRIKCDSRNSTIEFLINYFKISDLQAEEIAKMSMYNLNVKSLEKFEAEKIEKESDVILLESIRRNPKEIDNIIMAELAEGAKKYGRPRQSKVITTEEAQSIIPESTHKIIVMCNGIIKKIDENQSIGKITTKDTDVVAILDNIPNNEYFNIFTDDGYMTKVQVANIPDSTKDSIGIDMTETLQLGRDSKIIYASTLKEDYKYIVFNTSKGLIKKTERSLYESSKVSKLMAILLNEGDKITNIMEINDNKHIMLYTRYGKCLSMNINEISTTGRMTKGVMSMNLEDDNDYVTEMLILSDEFKYLTVVTERGYMKKCELYTLPISGRNGNVYPIATTTKDNRIFKVILSNDNDVINVVTTEEKYEVNVNSVNELTRLSKCERLKDVKFKVVERLIRVSVN